MWTNPDDVPPPPPPEPNLQTCYDDIERSSVSSSCPGFRAETEDAAFSASADTHRQTALPNGACHEVTATCTGRRQRHLGDEAIPVADVATIQWCTYPLADCHMDLDADECRQQDGGTFSEMVVGDNCPSGETHWYYGPRNGEVVEADVPCNDEDEDLDDALPAAAEGSASAAAVAVDR